MRAQTVILGVGLAGAAALWYWTRQTQAGASALEGATDTGLDFIDVTASRITNAFLSRGYRNNNPGNIRFIVKNPWQGQVGNDGGYGVYDTPQNGTRAVGRQLRSYAKRGLVSVRDIIGTWAPTNENNTHAYIADVSGALDVDPDDALAVTTRLPELARAIAKHENGYVDSDYDWNWANL